MAVKHEVVDQLVGNAHGNLDVVRQVLDEHPELVEARAEWGESALEAASQMGRKDIAALLIERGAEPDFFAHCMLGDVEAVRAALDADPGLARAAGVHELAPLYFAARGDELEVAELLLERGADVNQAVEAGAPVHAAAANGSAELVRRYLAAGADPLVRDYDGRTAREVAEAAGRRDLLDLL